MRRKMNKDVYEEIVHMSTSILETIHEYIKETEVFKDQNHSHIMTTVVSSCLATVIRHAVPKEHVEEMLKSFCEQVRKYQENR